MIFISRVIIIDNENVYSKCNIKAFLHNVTNQEYNRILIKVLHLVYNGAKFSFQWC